MEDIFSQNTDSTLTNTVLLYNSMQDGEEKRRIEKELIRKMEMLIFFLPLKNGYLSNEDISEFYLRQRENALDIIRCYVISKASFIHYLSEVLRKRARIFVLQKHKLQKKELILTYADTWTDSYDHYYVSDAEREYITDKEDHFEFSGIYDDYTLPQLITHLITERLEAEERSLTRIERELSIFLRNQKARKDFIILLLHVPSDSIRHNSLAIAKALTVEEEIIIKFFDLKDAYCRKRKEEKREEIRNLVLRHYKSLIRLNLEYTFSTSSCEERKAILEYEQRVLASYKKRVKQLNRMSSGLSLSEISKIMNYTRASISMGMKKSKEKLEEMKNRLSASLL